MKHNELYVSFQSRGSMKQLLHLQLYRHEIYFNKNLLVWTSQNSGNFQNKIWVRQWAVAEFWQVEVTLIWWAVLPLDGARSWCSNVCDVQRRTVARTTTSGGTRHICPTLFFTLYQRDRPDPHWDPWNTLLKQIPYRHLKYQDSIKQNEDEHDIRIHQNIIKKYQYLIS